MYLILLICYNFTKYAKLFIVKNSRNMVVAKRVIANGKKP